MLLYATPGRSQLARASDDVFFRGRIESAKVDAFISFLEKRQVSRVRLTSYGGEEAAAIRLGKYLRDRRISVVADRVCMSSCSQYVLLASHDPQILPRSLVAFHISSYALGKTIAIRSPDAGTAMAIGAEVAETAKATESLLSPVRLQILTKALDALEIQCIERRQDTGAGRSRVKMRFSFWVPTSLDLAMIGLRAPEGWPTDRMAALDLVQKTIGSSSGAFAFGPTADRKGALSLCAPQRHLVDAGGL